jgi:hypothetical protein
MMATVPIKQSNATHETVEEQFHRLAELWHRETDHLSSEASRHPAYQEIVGLGAAVVPCLLRDLEKSHTHWFAALRTLTGAQSIPADVAGNVPKMAEAWLRWAKNNGYRW